MKVLVTGGNGFIGRYVCEELRNRGHVPLVFDRHWPWELLHPGETYQGDILDSIAVTEGMAHCEAFIHLAAVLGTQETIANPIPAALTNIHGGLNVLQAAAQYEVPGVYIGVGNHWMDNTYSISKTTVERFVRMFNRERGTRINVVRVVNAYGPGQVAAAPYGPGKIRKIIPSFVCRALAGDDIEIYGDGEQVSDMVYVEDVASVLVASIPAGPLFTSAIEVGPAHHTTVNEVAEMIVERAGSDSAIVHLPMRPGEIPGAEVTADLTNLRTMGYVPEAFTPLGTGLNNTIDYFRGRT